MIRSAPTGFSDLVGVQRRTVERRTITNADSFQPHERIAPHTYGQFIAIEAKADDGEQSPEQIAFQSAVESVAGIYILARSVEDVLAVLGPDLTP